MILTTDFNWEGVNGYGVQYTNQVKSLINKNWGNNNNMICI